MDNQPATIDKQRAVDTFLAQIGNLERLPLVSDVEFTRLYGEEVASTLAVLDNANGEASLCDDCGGKCCSAAGCELYSDRFDWCPIYSYRPVVCRLHFCHRFETAGRQAVVDLSDVFFDSLLAAESQGDERVRLFDSPPLERNAPQLTAAAAGWMSDLAAGTLSPKRVAGLLRRETAKFRTADSRRNSPARS